MWSKESVYTHDSDTLGQLFSGFLFIATSWGSGIREIVSLHPNLVLLPGSGLLLIDKVYKSWGKHTKSGVMRRSICRLTALKYYGGALCVYVHVQKCVSTNRGLWHQIIFHSYSPLYCDRAVEPGLCQFQFISWACLWGSLSLPQMLRLWLAAMPGQLFT